MVMVLAVTLLLSYIILTLLLYNQNLSILESEVRQEAKIFVLRSIYPARSILKKWMMLTGRPA